MAEKKETILSPRLAQRLGELERRILDKIPVEKPPIKKRFATLKDACKFIGTLFLLWAWGYETYVTKHDQSVRDNINFVRLQGESMLQNLKTADGAMQIATMLYNANRTPENLKIAVHFSI